MAWPKFPSPKSSLIVDENIDLALLDTDPKLRETFHKHPFNQYLKIAIANDVETPENRLFPQSGADFDPKFRYLLVKACPIHLLIHPVLIESYVTKGNLFASSVGRNVVLEDCLALSSGSLTLSLTDTTYRRLGLLGSKSILVRKKKIVQKYTLVIDLNSVLVKNSTTNYFQRTFRLMRCSGLKFDILLKWEPANESFSSVSIIKFFDWVKANPGPNGAFLLEAEKDAIEIKVSLCQPGVEWLNKANVLCPTILMEDFDSSLVDKLSNNQVSQETPSCILIDWLGAQFADVNMGLADPDVTSFLLPDSEACLVQSLSLYEYSGFFTTKDVLSLISRLQDHIRSNKTIPFVAIIAIGFENSCISWEGKNNEHGVRVSGENLIGLVLKKETDRKSRNFLWRIADEYDFGIERL